MGTGSAEHDFFKQQATFFGKSPLLFGIFYPFTIASGPKRFFIAKLIVVNIFFQITDMIYSTSP